MHQNEGTANECYEIVYIGREGYRYSCRICHVILTHQSYASLARYAAKHLETHALEKQAEWKAKREEKQKAEEKPTETLLKSEDREKGKKMIELLKEASRLNEGRSWLVKQLQDPDYRKLYVKYLVWVENKRLSPKLLARLDPELQHELVELWNAEWKEFKKTWR
jgi:hypothetical protein